MKCTIERSAFLKALSHVHGVVERRVTVPILSNIYLETRSDELHLRATDLDLEIAETVFCETKRAGCATVHAYTLYEIIKKLPEKVSLNIEHDSEKEQLVLRSGKSRFSLRSLPVADFPAVIGNNAFTVTFSVKDIDLRSLIERTYFAMSTEATRYSLNGISLYAAHSSSGNVLRAVATDGYRLARTEISLPLNAYDIPNIILPRKTVKVLLALMNGLTTTITVSLSRTNIRFAFGQGPVLISKLTDGAFPDCERVIPQHNDKMIEVNARSLAEAVGRVATVMSADQARAIKLAVRKDSVVLSAANSTTTDSAVDELETAASFAPLSIGFNSRYLLDILGQMESKTVCLAFSDSSSPTIVREGSNDSALYLLMPMRV